MSQSPDGLKSAESASEDSDSCRFPPEIASLLEQYERLLDAGSRTSPDEFVAEHAAIPEHSKALLNAIAMVLRLREAAADPDLPSPADSETIRAIHELAMLRTEDEILQFRILCELGRGGMGIVYRAHDGKLGRDVALKVISPAILKRCVSAEAEVERFAQEARAMAALAHPHLVRVNGIHRWKQTWFFDMELLSGAPLGELLRELVHANSKTGILPVEGDKDTRFQRDDLSQIVSSLLQPNPLCRTDGSAGPPQEFFDQVARIGIQIADALDYAHGKGVLHRDIKPSNLMIECDLSVKIMDFGLARSGTNWRASSADSAGSLRFMAPERFGSGPLPQSDLYSVGVTLLEMIAAASGVQPADTLAGSIVETIESQGFQQRTSLRTLVSACPIDLVAIVDKAAAPDIKSRYATAKDLSDDLQNYLKRAPTTARPWSVLKRLSYFVRNHLTAAVVMLAMSVCLAIVVPAFLMTDDALRESQEANSRSAMLLNELELSNTVQIVRNAQRLIELGLRDDGLKELVAVSPEMESWDTAWLQQAGQTNLISRVTLANGDWSILDIAFSPDRRLLAACTAGGQLCVWNVETGMLVAQLMEGRLLEAPGHSPRYLHFFEDRIADTDVVDWKDQCAVCLGWVDSQTLRCITLDGEVAEYSITSAGANSHHIVSPRSLIHLHESLNCALISSTGQRLVVGTASGRVLVADLSDSGDPRVTEMTTSAAELSPLTAACRDDSDGVWILGHRNGLLRAVKDDAQQLWHQRVPGPVWSLDVKHSDDATLIAVGAETDEVTLLSWKPADTSPAAFTVRVPGLPIKPQAIHLISFNDHTDNELLLTDSLHRVMRIDVSERRVTDVERTLSGDPRFLQKRSLQLFYRTPDSLPECFRKCVSVCRSAAWPTDPSPARTDDDHENVLIFAGQNNTISVWQDVKHIGQPRARQLLHVAAGPEPVLFASPNSSSLCWTLGRDGFLQIVSIETDQAVARLDLGDLKPTTMTIGTRDGSDVCLVLCGDGLIRPYAFRNKALAPDDSPSINGADGLLSLAADSSLNRIAGVDRDGRLSIWQRLPDGKFSTQKILPTSDEALFGTGRVVVSTNGQWIAAGSSGQAVITAAYDAESNSYKPFRNELDIAGDGIQTISLCSQLQPDQTMCFATDSLRRVRVSELRESGNRKPAPSYVSEFLESVCEQLIPTSDSRRMALLQRNGQVLFLAATTPDIISSVRSTLENCCDICFSRDGRWMVVANRNGQLERFDTQAEPSIQETPPLRNSQTNSAITDWQVRSEQIPTEGGTCSAHSTMLSTSAAGTWCVLVPLVSGSGGDPFLGNLLCAESNGKHSAQLNPLESVVDLRAVATAVRPSNGRPAVVFRTVSSNRALTDVYSGDLSYAELSSDGQWTVEQIDSRENFGFNPVLSWSADGQPVVFHYSYDSPESIVHRRGSDGVWKRSPIGHRRFRVVGVHSEDSASQWIVAGDCGRFYSAHAPSSILTVNDRFQWQYIDWPVTRRPMRILQHANESVLVSVPTDFRPQPNVLLQKFAFPAAHAKEVRLPMGLRTVIDAIALSDASFLCVWNDDGVVRLLRASLNEVSEIQLPELPRFNKPSSCIRLQRLADDRISIIFADTLVGGDNRVQEIRVVTCTARL